MALLTTLVHPALSSTQGVALRRQAARAIVLRDDHILLLFTERYNDFSLPGGGVDAGEDLAVGLVHELAEETGAQDIQVQEYLGYIEEYRPHWQPEYDLMHMTSHLFTCAIAPTLASAKMESYEVANGMRPLWVPVHEAIAHNQAVMQRQEASMGLSIVRETYVLEKIARDFLAEAEVAV